MMSGRICVITGANSGIGKEAALALAKKRAHIVMLCRNLDKAKAARAEIIAESGNDLVDIVSCDLADLASVREAADTILHRYEAVHVLVNNAGFMTLEKQHSAQGYESTLAVNYLGHVLLTMLLLTALKNAAPARIINLSSIAHKMARLDLNDLLLEKTPYKGFTAYANSKLAKLLFTCQLAKQLEDDRITVNAVDPGMVYTEFGDKIEFPLAAKIFTNLLRPIVKKPADGAATAVQLASDPMLEKVTGTVWKNGRKVSPSKTAQDPDLQRDVFARTLQLMQPYLISSS